ncbi:hypothetical protein ES702_03114 [subsurface metagenome]
MIVELMSARYNIKRSKNQIPDIEPLSLKGYMRTKSKDVTVEERMLSDHEVNPGYMRQ